MQQYKQAIFIKECKHRFKCIVKINNIEEYCYVASSSKLSNYLNLENQEVLLRKIIKKKSSFKYALFAIKFHESYILLDLLFTNKIIENYLINNKSINKQKIKIEQKIEDYKSDIFYNKNNEKHIFEVKSLISTEESAIFPNEKSTRIYTQLRKIKNLLLKKYTVYFWIVSLNPYCNNLNFNINNKEFIDLYNECTKLGLKTFFSTIKWDNNQFIINSNIQIS